jgi:hypothetical protein
MATKTKDTRVPLVEQMDDETFIRHLEKRHGQDLAMEFKPLPGQEGQPRRMLTRLAHETYHALLHRWAEEGKEGHSVDHFHDYPHVAKTARPRGPRPGTVIRDKQSQELVRWDGQAWRRLPAAEAESGPVRLALPSSK